MDQEWDLSIQVTERYALGPLGEITSVKPCKHVTRSQKDVIPRERERVLVGNEIELGIVIPTIGSRTSDVPRDKGNGIQR